MKLGDPTQLDFLWAVFRPLLTTDEAAYLLGDTSDDLVIKLVDNGAVRAVNIAAEDDTRRCLRVYRYSLEHRLLYPGQPLTMLAPETIFPHNREKFRRDEVAVLLNCTARHVANLNLPGPRISAEACQASIDRTPRHWRAGLIEFLQSREIK